MKFSILTEICYRGTLLYANYNFNVYFFKIIFIHIFLGKFGSKIWSSSNWLRFHTGVHCYELITTLMFIFSMFLPFIFFGLIWTQNLKVSKLTEIVEKCFILDVAWIVDPSLTSNDCWNVCRLHLVSFAYVSFISIFQG